MIIIKIIFLYFIEIAHADDFPSMGTRLVLIIGHDRTHSVVCSSSSYNSEVVN